ncbi:PsbP domain-containing protein 4, chloroplastic isoform X2 [Tanacetum coccineum]|uniref:PsbP domain-containing protein 4, chloroplastic isoform X2 n=1 Tax=Tanacetum coccineum TaxID=301880 RepID=A0ABQ5DBV2_9ASTR
MKLVSIADPGGTEIDLRFSNASEGRITVVVAPVLRFADYLEDDARIEKIGPPEKVINKFGLEVIGQNVEGKVMNSEVKEYSGRKYYQFELELPHCLITATATGTVFTCSAYLQMVTYNPLSLSANKSAITKRTAAAAKFNNWLSSKKKKNKIIGKAALISSVYLPKELNRPTPFDLTTTVLWASLELFLRYEEDDDLH